MSPTVIVAYLALFTFVGAMFLFVNLLVGKFLRPKAPNAEKLEVYECGEPTIGSSFVQFDLRFYVVALLFIIFDVEVAFFFPWATVFGKATHLMDPNAAVVQEVAVAASPLPVAKPGEAPQSAAAGPRTLVQLTPAAAGVLSDMGVPNPELPDPKLSAADNDAQIRASARRLALTSIADILVFFAVLMVGFAYVWMRGDLDWVRALGKERSMASRGSPVLLEEDEPELVG